MKLRFICGETKICSTIKRSYIMNMTVASRDLTKDLLVLKNKAMNSQFGKQRRFRSTVVTGTPFSIPPPPPPPQKTKNTNQHKKTHIPRTT